MAFDLSKLKVPQLNVSFLQSKEIVGVDIGNFGIKVVLLKGTAGKYSLVKWGSSTLPEAVLSEASPENKKNECAKLLKKIVGELNLTGKRAAASVSGNSVIVRYVKFPKLSAADLNRSIQFEAEPFIPFDIRDVNISFHILHDVVDEGQKKMETILVAAKKDLVQSKIDILREAGLKPAVIDVDAFALENAYSIGSEPNKQETVLFVNIGANVTNMCIIENGVSKVVRDVFISGGSISKALSKNLQCGIKEAEELKLKFGLLVTTEEKDKALAEDNKEAIQISNIMYPVVKDLLAEVQRSLDFYLSQSTDRAVHKILIGGGTSKLKNLDACFAHELKLPVEVFNPFTNIKGSEKLAGMQVGDYAVAVGLASRKAGDSIV